MPDLFKVPDVPDVQDLMQDIDTVDRLCAARFGDTVETIDPMAAIVLVQTKAIISLVAMLERIADSLDRTTEEINRVSGLLEKEE